VLGEGADGGAEAGDLLVLVPSEVGDLRGEVPDPAAQAGGQVLPAVLAVGIGLSVNNAKAVIEALLGHESEFTRTPKYRVEGASDEWKQKRYRGTLSFLPFVELLLGLYFTAMAGYAFVNGIYGTLPFILIFQAGFLYAACLSLFQDVARFMVPREQEA
jgi:hypothetical protein